MAATGLRRWSALGLLLVGPAVTVLVMLALPGPSGHWSGHVGSAAGAIGVALALVTAALLVRDRLAWPLLVTLGVIGESGAGKSTLLGLVIGVGLALEALGSYRAARAIWRTAFDDREAGIYGHLDDGFEWGHTVAAWGDSLVTVGSLGFAILLGMSRQVRTRVAVVGGVLCLVPAWIYPALGPLLLLAWMYGSSAARALRPNPEADPAVGLPR